MSISLVGSDLYSKLLLLNIGQLFYLLELILPSG